MGTIRAIKESAPGTAIDLESVRARLHANRKTLASRLLERIDILAGLDTALVAGEHVLLVGPPGTAKSHLARSWASQVAGVYREDLLTRQSTEADHLAFLDVQAFTQGSYVYRYDGKIVEAHVAFVDEAFKATGGFLNALLGWLNERNVRGGYKSPLITAIAASNEFGEDESVAALEDWLLFRFFVERIQARGNRLSFLAACATPAAPIVLLPVSVDEIRAAQNAAAALPFEPLVFEALADVQDMLQGAGVVVSDRRMAKCVRILQAFAWIDGSAIVELDHLDVLRHVLWRRPEDRPAVDAALSSVNRGVIGEIRTVVERLLDIYHAAKAKPDFAKEALNVAQRLADGGADLRARYGDKLPMRVKERAQSYLVELRAAYEDCKKSAALTV